MTLNGVMAVTLCYFTEFGKPVLQKTICGRIYARVYCIFSACTMLFTFAISSPDEFLVKKLLLRNRVVYFVEICNECAGKAITEAAKGIINSDKVCRSYSDLNFGVTFFGTPCKIITKITLTTCMQTYITVSLAVFIILPTCSFYFTRLTLEHFKYNNDDNDVCRR